MLAWTGVPICRELRAEGPLPGANPLAEREGYAVQLGKLDGTVLATDRDKAKQLGQMLSRSARSRRDAINQSETRAWEEIKTRQDWEPYRDIRVRALRDSLGRFPPVPKDLKVRVTRTLEGDGFRIENLVFETRPGVVATANLYQPAKSHELMPGILICHSHHNPKSQGELQDMGMTWARLGCLVLVMDQLGHGERRQHPFVDNTSYPQAFRPGRQDYYFRYNIGIQLHLLGDSLMGWMVWDLERGVDLLRARPGIDKTRIILLGAVAGGGDPAAVVAALDPRIAAVVPFNFGGPQPETTYPLPADVPRSFNYAGSGSWESTRNLRLSARDSFLPWIIVGAVAPRRLIYAHEFSWDREHDPVWTRLEKVFSFYEARDHLASTHGRGTVSGKPPDSTHCNNIGAEHRQQIYPSLKKWFGIAIPGKEYQKRHAAEDLVCLTPELGREMKSVSQTASEVAAERMAAARRSLADLGPEDRRRQLRRDWARVLGDVEPKSDPQATEHREASLGTMRVKYISLEVEPNIVVPLLLLLPPLQGSERIPVVVAVGQEGKQAFLANRSQAIARLLGGGVAVCLPDVRGTGETQPPGGARGRTSASTNLSSSELMLGQTLVGSRLRDLRSVVRFLRTRPYIEAKRMALWGDSFAKLNPDDFNPAVPLDAQHMPGHSEPLGGLLSLFGALFEEDIHAVYVRGGLIGYQSILQSPFCYVPHDVIVPGALNCGDLCDVAAALAPCPLRLGGLVDGLNRLAAADEITKTFQSTKAAYAQTPSRFVIDTDSATNEQPGEWLVGVLLGNSASGQSDLTVLQTDRNGNPPRKMLYTYLQKQAEQKFAERRAAVAACKTKEDVKRRQVKTKEFFLEALGGFPERTPLNPRVVAREEKSAYVTERVIYESRPNHHVTAVLYLPQGKPPFPGVLVPCGHSANGKAAEAYQRACILMARNGLAVLCYDPIGQGERVQLLTRDGKPAIAGSTSEHTMVGVGALLIGQNTATYRVWDGIRSLDYLTGRKEVDAKRLGCTGNSGGGTLTAYLMALDDRIVAAAPSCYITSLERLFATIGPQDAEQNITGQVRFWMEHADYITMRAPKPTLLCVATEDFFDIQGAWTTFREAKRIYGLLGHGERIDLFEYNDKHGFSKPRREAAMRWMRRWLLQKDDAPVEEEFAILKDAELQCTRSGQVLEDFKGKSAFDFNAEREKELRTLRIDLQQRKTAAEMLEDVRRLINYTPRSVPSNSENKLESVTRDGYSIHQKTYATEPGIVVPALHFVPAEKTSQQLIVYVHGSGKAVDAGGDGPIEAFIKSGDQVLVLDLRGMGETAPGSPAARGPNYFGTDSKEAFLALHLDRPLLGQRVYDLLSVVELLLKNSGTKDMAIHLIGIGSAGPIVLHAAALEPRIRQVTVEKAIVSWSSVVRTPVSIDQLTNVVPAVLKVYDLPDLAALIAPRPLTVRCAVDGAQKPISQEALETEYTQARATYRKKNAENNLILTQE
jgi:cephalosporin-C deacetylase-like acetyl esterase